MSGSEILEVLKREKKGTTAEEMSEEIGVNVFAIQRSLKRLVREMLIERKKLTKEEVINQGKRYTGRHYVWFIRK